jgi:general secretion pathway protein J
MNRSAGFTLIEMLVALAVTSLLMVAGSTLLIQTLRSGRMVEARTELVRDQDTAHSLLRDDLANATLRLTQPPNGLDTPKAFSGGISTLEPLLAFTRSGWINPGNREPRGDLQRVEYFLSDGNLVRRAWLRPDPVYNTPYADRVVAEGLDDVGLRFLTGTSWQLDWPGQAAILPDLVELTLVFGEGDELRQLFLVGGAG